MADEPALSRALLQLDRRLTGIESFLGPLGAAAAAAAAAAPAAASPAASDSIARRTARVCSSACAKAAGTMAAQWHDIVQGMTIKNICCETRF